MGSLFRYESRKLRHSITFYILIAVGLLWVFINVLTVKISGAEGDSATALAQARGGISNGLFTVLTGLFIAIFICEDYGNGAIKNVISRGYTSLEVYFCKYWVTLIAAAIMAIADCLFGFILGFAFWGKLGDFTAAPWATILTMVLSVTAYHALFFGLSMVLRKSGAAIAINIITPMGMTLILMAIDMLLGNAKISFSTSDYWINGILSNATGSGVDTSRLYWGLGILVLYGIAFFLIGYLPNHKRDLK